MIRESKIKNEIENLIKIKARYESIRYFALNQYPPEVCPDHKMENLIDYVIREKNHIDEEINLLKSLL